MSRGMLTTNVLVDANVLYSKTLRDWLALSYLRQDGWFEVKWTEDILAEVVYNLRKDHPLFSDQQIGGVRDKIVGTFPAGRISDYEIDPTPAYPDIFDAHVHAAAIHGGVDIVLTIDRGFSQLGDLLDELPYELHSPDSFLCLLDDASPRSIQQVTQEQLDYWAKRSGRFNLCTQLENAGAPQFADRVRQHLRTCRPPG